MDRRVFLLGAAALSGCGPGDRPVRGFCDRELAAPLQRAWRGYAAGGDLLTEGMGVRELLEEAGEAASVLVATRESLIANRLQRLGRVRLEHRWTVNILGASAAVLVTKGGFEQRRVLKFAEWLASDEAAPFLGAGGAISGR